MPDFIAFLWQRTGGEVSLSAQWTNYTNTGLGRIKNGLGEVLRVMAQEEHARRLRRLLILALLVWIVFSLVTLAWSFLPHEDQLLPEQVQVLNPVEGASTSAAAESVDVQALRGWHLFGEAGKLPADEAARQAEEQAAAAQSDRDGIEEGAAETRLALTLRGVLAASEDGLGHAIIEHQSKQAVYAIDDTLPVAGQVKLAKVLADRVVLDNGGKYELLKLFDESTLLGQLPATGPSAPAAHSPRPAPRTMAAPVDKRTESDVTAVAKDYRQRLYSNPQSLAEVVRLSAVREGNTLVGYRINPGKDGEQFTQLGFKPGDVVTSVNGIDLGSPENTMQLYQIMRTAGEAEFTVDRDGSPIVLTVSLSEASEGGAQ